VRGCADCRRADVRFNEYIENYNRVKEIDSLISRTSYLSDIDSYMAWVHYSLVSNGSFVLALFYRRQKNRNYRLLSITLYVYTIDTLASKINFGLFDVQ
jgi:hypothetical protein